MVEAVGMARLDAVKAREPPSQLTRTPADTTISGVTHLRRQYWQAIEMRCRLLDDAADSSWFREVSLYMLAKVVGVWQDQR